MENSVTFEFRNKRDWLLVYEALNDMAVKMCSYAYKCITVWGDKNIAMVRENCEEVGIKFKEV